MGSSNVTALAMELEELIRAAHKRHRWELYWPHQFVEAKVAELDEVIEALGILVNAGKLNAYVEVRCGGENSHTISEGPPHEVLIDGHVRLDCAECEEPGDYGDGGVFLFYRMTSDWIRRLPLTKKAAQKKSLALVLS